MLKELMSRESHGLQVSLFFEDDSKSDPRIPPLVVGVHSKGLPSFIARADNAREGMEIYRHPYACLNRLLKTGKVAGN